MKSIRVGAFGNFRPLTSKKIIDIWKQLEDMYLDENNAWIGIYHPFDLLRWAKDSDILTKDEVDMLKNALI